MVLSLLLYIAIVSQLDKHATTRPSGAGGGKACTQLEDSSCPTRVIKTVPQQLRPRKTGCWCGVGIQLLSGGRTSRDYMKQQCDSSLHTAKSHCRHRLVSTVAWRCTPPSRAASRPHWLHPALTDTREGTKRSIQSDQSKLNPWPIFTCSF